MGNGTVQRKRLRPDRVTAFDERPRGDITRRDFMNRLEVLTAGSLVTAAVLGATGSPAAEAQAAQTQAETSDPEALAMFEKWFAVRNPSARHDVLARLAGDWDVRLRFHAGDQSWESRCASRSELVHGGRFLLEHLSGEVFAPDSSGAMRPEPYTATRTLGYDNYKNAYTGAFIDNQNTYLLTFLGHTADSMPVEIEMYGTQDEPMMDMHDGMMKYVLSFHADAGHSWTVYALAAGSDVRLFDFEYSR